MEVFEQKYKPGLDRDAATLLALEALRSGLEEAGNLAQVEVCTVERGEGMTRLTAEEIQKYVARLPAAGAAPRGGRS